MDKPIMYPPVIQETETRRTGYFDFKARQEAIYTLKKYFVISEAEFEMLKRRCEDLDRSATGKDPIPESFKNKA